MMLAQMAASLPRTPLACHTVQRCQCAGPQQGCQGLGSHAQRHTRPTCVSAHPTRAHRVGGARPAAHHTGASAQIGSGHGVHRELLDCWPGCSRASWIEGGPELNGSIGSGGSGGSGMAMSAAALAEPPAEPAAAEPPDEAGTNTVIRINEPEEFEQQLVSHGSDLVVLMCKAHSCRPCKMFTRKYQRIAEAYPGVTFLEIYGDDSKETRKLMISMSIRVTPNFRLYIDGKLVEQLSGINETNLRNAIEKALHPEEAEQAEEAAASS